MVIVLTLVLLAPAASAIAQIVDVTITADVRPDYCTLFGQTQASPATVSFLLDTSAPIHIPAGTLIGPSAKDYFLTDLYGYRKSALFAISATYGNKTWDLDDVSDGPFGGYAPNPSATVWFDGPVTPGGNALPTILFEDSDGRLQTAPAACGWADLGGACALIDSMDVWEQGYYYTCRGLGGPLQVEVVSSRGDFDGDGVLDSVDECPNSNLSATVVIDGCNSEVPNTLFASGCTISDRVMACAEGASAHGPFMSCVSQVTDGLRADRVITGRWKDAIQRCAAKADIP